MTAATFAGRLHAVCETACPIIGVSVGRKLDKGTWRIDLAEDATEEQRTALQQILDELDPALLLPDPPVQMQDQGSAPAQATTSTVDPQMVANMSRAMAVMAGMAEELDQAMRRVGQLEATLARLHLEAGQDDGPQGVAP